MNDVNLLNLAIKLVTWAASPLGLFCIGFAFAWLLKILCPSRIWAVSILSLAALQLIVFSLSTTAYWLHRELESQAVTLARANTGPPYTAILALGGLTRSTESPLTAGWQPDLTEAADRITHAAHLWHEGLAPLVIVSGGVWPSSPQKPAEAVWMQQLLLQLGIPQQNIWLETTSTTTRENVRGVADLLQRNDSGGRLALVTSASHMPRAYRNAERAGLTVDAFPTDWQARAIEDHPMPWLPNADALASSSRALKEWIALTADY